LVGLVRRLPGFRGYFELEERRASDALLREHLAGELERAKRSTDLTARALADAGQIDPLPQFDQLRGQIDRIIGRLRGAPRGYSGLFDLRRVDAKLLEDIYAHDQTLVDQVNAFRTLVDGWGGGPQAAVTGLAEARQKLDLIDRGCDERADLLKRFVESHSQAT
jgi:hypothetical protein